MADDSKSGPLTVDDLVAVWTAAVDPSYGQAFIQAGEGGGFEAYTQGFAQFARVSQAIDITSQAQYILPSSAQTNAPAMGENLATVTLSISRTLYLDRPLVIGAGLIYFQEVASDWSPTGPTPILTGRLYTLEEDLVFLPGDSGPFLVTAVAAGPGWGYNNPQIGTITNIVQVGSGFNNDLATVTDVVTATSIIVSVISQNEPDTFVPEHIGQYMLFTAGNNAGIMARIIGFEPPNPPVAGSTVQLEDFVSVEAFSAITGTFQVGEQVQIKSGATIVGTGLLKAARAGAAGHTKIGFVLVSGAVSVGNTVHGVVSTASATVSFIHADPAFVSEAPTGNVGGATWDVLDWVNDLGVVVTNTEQPSGGTLGILDAIGADRNIPRLPDETDSAYRIRIWQIADVVTPNAIIRALNRLLGVIPFCFREVGTPLLPGFFYDGNNQSSLQVNGTFTPDAYDYDVLLFPGTTTSGQFAPWPVVPGLQGTFDVTNGSVTVPTTANQVGIVSAGDQIEFWSQPGIFYTVLGVGSSDILLTTVYSGVNNTAALASDISLPLIGSTYAGGGFQEPVQYRDASGNVKATGYLGRIASGVFTMIRKSGQGSLASPVEWASGDVIVGLISGGVWTTSSNTPVTTPAQFREHLYLDYTDFRAMFLIGVPRVSYGEFGFAWAGLPAGGPGSEFGAYDVASIDNFYDGFAVGASTLYLSVYNQINRIRAGGVTFDLYIEDGSCT